MTIWLNAPFRLQFRVIDGLTVRFARSESEGPDQALLLSPWPESLLAFEPVWWRLAEHASLVAIDLPGFGHSQRRDTLLSPRAMSEFVIAAADAFGLEHPHLIAPGTGTAAGLFAAARCPGRLRSLVVGTGAPAVTADVGDPLASMKRSVTQEAVLDDYRTAYRGSRFADSVRYLRAYPTDLPALARLLPWIAAPVLIIAGAHDAPAPLANAAFMAGRLPHSRLDILDAGHFTWEDAADEYAALVTSWWQATRGQRG